MFTGIVSAVGTIARVARDGDRLRVTIAAPYADLAPGESIAVNGACLTVVASGDGTFEVEVVETTRERTRLADLGERDRVNLERALALGDRLGGHLVQGHVDGVGTVRRVDRQGDTVLVDVEVPDEVGAVTLSQGSITVDGVSLTVSALPAPGVVRVALVPYTREHTTLGALERGDRVHVEGDVIGKYVTELLDKAATGGRRRP